MGSRSCGAVVTKVVKKMVDQVVGEFEELALLSHPSGNAAGDAGEVRRSGRERKAPDRLQLKIPRVKHRAVQIDDGDDDYQCEVIMEPAPSDLKGILRPPQAFPPVDKPARKSSLSATAVKTIKKKYRKVRITRLLKFKVIPPLPGWRADRMRMPETVPDEEEQKRLDELERLEQQQKKKTQRKRKSIAPKQPTATSDEEESATKSGGGGGGADGEQVFPPGSRDLERPHSPELYYEAYMSTNSPDSVLTTDTEAEEGKSGSSSSGARGRKQTRKPVQQQLFPPIKDASPADAASGSSSAAAAAAGPPQSSITVAGSSSGAAGAAEDTVAAKPLNRRRSIRIQPGSDDDQKAAEKKDRRKSRMFPVTPMKDSPRAAKEESEEKTEDGGETAAEGGGAAKKKTAPRRRSGATLAFGGSSSASTAKPEAYGDTLCRTEAACAEDRREKRERKKEKVTEWLTRGKGGGAGAGGDVTVDESEETQSSRATTESLSDETRRETVESARALDSAASNFSEDKASSAGSSSSSNLLEATELPTRRRGRRSMYAPAREKKQADADHDEHEKVEVIDGRGEGEKENVAAASKSDESSSAGKKPQPHHPFFAAFGAPKTQSPVATTSAIIAPEAGKKKNVRRRSMAAPKKPLAAAKKGAAATAATAAGDESDDAIEIVAEVAPSFPSLQQQRGADGDDDLVVLPPPPSSTTIAPSATTTTAVWRQTAEIDAAPYAGLTHTGRDFEDDDSAAAAAGREEEGGGAASAADSSEGVAKKMRRLSVRLPQMSSYAIPPSLLEGERALRVAEGDDDEPIPLFDDVRQREPSSARFDGWLQRARGLPSGEVAGVVDWTERARPRRVEECIGDQEVLQRGRRWLQRWGKRLDAAVAEEENSTRAPKAKKRKRRAGGRGGEESEEEEEDSDPDYDERRDEESGGRQQPPNPLVLSGPVGCGKSAYIAALSSECGFVVLESGPDERRSGASLRTKLAGAVANYRMSSAAKPGGIASFFATKPQPQQQGGGASTAAAPAAESAKKQQRQQHTLVVIEHVDVVFAEEDRLFWPALTDILMMAKIPIILTCNTVPAELTRVLRLVEEAGTTEPMEIAMQRAGVEVEEYVEATLSGCSGGRTLSATVVPAIVARARGDLRAALHDAQWAAAAAATGSAAGAVVGKRSLADRSLRRVDEAYEMMGGAAAAATGCSSSSSQSLSVAWTDESERRRAAMGDCAELARAAAWPARGRMPTEEYARIVCAMDVVDQDELREAAAREARAMSLANTGLAAGRGACSIATTRRELAEDWMPMLAQIDERESEKKRENRRHQHYFAAVNLATGRSVDPLDRLQPACAFFRLPKTEAAGLQ